MITEEIAKELPSETRKMAVVRISLLMLFSFVFLTSGAFLAAACMFFSALILTNRFEDAFNRFSKIKLRRWHRFAGISLLILVGLSSLPPIEESPSERTPIAPRDYRSVQHKPLKEIDSFSADRVRKIASAFATFNEVDAEYHDAFYRCLGDKVRSKNGDLELETVMGWCLGDYERDPDKFKMQQSAYSYFDLKEQFSDWDGSHRSSVEAIKRAMHDGSSYKHVETRYNIIRVDDSKIHLIVMTRFRGTNLFGGVVTSLARTTVDAETGHVLNIEIE